MRVPPPRPPDDPADPESAELLSRFADGDDSALGRLVEKEAPWLLRRIEAKIPPQVKRRLGASDLLQATALSLMQVRDRFKNNGVRAFRRMLATLADRSVTQAVRREYAAKRDPAVERHAAAYEATSQNPLKTAPAEQTTPSAALIRKESALLLKRCYARLRKEEREIIRLVDYQQFGYDKAAEAIRVSSDAARQRHHRAIARLREMLEVERADGR